MNPVILTSQKSPGIAPLSSTSPPGAPMKWMWGAIAALGACVVALATTLVVQSRPATSSAAQPVAQAAPADAGGARMDSSPASSKAPLALAAQAAPTGAATAASSRMPSGAAASPPSSSYASGYGAPPTTRGQPVGASQVSRAPVCTVCGTVESVQAVQQAEPATGVGAVAGGVLGAVVGNQIGKGNGRAAATVLGAVGGGYVGHQVEQRTRTRTVYQVAVRMEDGSLRRFQRAQAPAVGTPVTLEGKGYRIDSQRANGGYGGGAYTSAPAGAVRVADSY